MGSRSARLATALLMGTAGAPAWAQIEQGQESPEAVVPERLSVLQRPRPDYDALGIRAGSFLVYPSLELDEGYNSNVYVTTHDTKDDFITTLRPDVRVRSDWAAHALSLDAGGEIRRFASEVSENASDAHLIADGRYDIERDVYVTGTLGYQLLHEDRTSPDTVANQKNPIQYQLVTGRVGYVHEPGRLGVRLDAGLDWYSFGNGVTSTGQTITETDRNRVVYSLTPRVSYEIVPGYHAFVKVPLNDREYQASRDAGGFDRNSRGYEIDAGTALDLGTVINGEVFVGYLNQDYSDDRLKSVSGVSYGANLLWNVTPLTSLRLNVLHSVEETTLGLTSSYLQTAVSPSIEHELMRNVLLTGGFSYVVQEFQGVSRTDHNYEGDLGVRYLLNRNLSLAVNALYRWRNSNAPLTDYDQSIVVARLRLQY